VNARTALKCDNMEEREGEEEEKEEQPPPVLCL
jgi:hypothetical protein